MSGERKGVLYVFIAAVLYSLGGLCIKLIPDWSGLALNAKSEEHTAELQSPR